MEDSPHSKERKSAARRSAALSFLSNISLGRDKQKNTTSVTPESPSNASPRLQNGQKGEVATTPLLDTSSSIQDRSQVKAVEIGDEVKREAPHTSKQRQYDEKEQAAINFLANIMLNPGGGHDKGKEPIDEANTSADLMALGTSLTSSGFPDMGRSLGTSVDGKRSIILIDFSCPSRRSWF